MCCDYVISRCVLHTLYCSSNYDNARVHDNSESNIHASTCSNVHALSSSLLPLFLVLQSLPSTGEASSSAAFPMSMGNPLLQAPGPQIMPWPAVPTSSQAHIPFMATGGVPVINGVPMMVPGFVSAGPYVNPMTVAATHSQAMIGTRTQHCLGN